MWNSMHTTFLYVSVLICILVFFLFCGGVFQSHLSQASAAVRGETVVPLQPPPPNTLHAVSTLDMCISYPLHYMCAFLTFHHSQQLWCHIFTSIRSICSQSQLTKTMLHITCLLHIKSSLNSLWNHCHSSGHVIHFIVTLITVSVLYCSIVYFHIFSPFIELQSLVFSLISSCLVLWCLLFSPEILFTQLISLLLLWNFPYLP